MSPRRTRLLSLAVAVGALGVAAAPAAAGGIGTVPVGAAQGPGNGIILGGPGSDTLQGGAGDDEITQSGPRP